jgi:hypothetical protein
MQRQELGSDFSLNSAVIGQRANSINMFDRFLGDKLLEGKFNSDSFCLVIDLI